MKAGFKTLAYSDDEIVNEGGVGVKYSQLKKFSSKELFGDAKEIVISHLGESYMLTLTKQKKLLLTKVKHQLAL